MKTSFSITVPNNESVDRFYFEFGWFPGNDFRLVSIDLLSAWYRSITFLRVQFLYLTLDFGIFIERDYPRNT